MKGKQYGLRTLILLTFVAGVVLAAFGTKLRQDKTRERAFIELSQLGFRSRIGDPHGLQFQYERPEALSDEKAKHVIHHLQILGKRYDLGFSPGNRIGRISFEGSRQDERVVELFKERLPAVSIRD